MAEPIIIAQDIGTSATKTTLVRSDGTILASQSTPHETLMPSPRRAEQRADDWWHGVCRNTRSLVEKHPAVREGAAVIGVSGHMLGCLPVDSDGRALRPCMIHSDSRAQEQYRKVMSTVGARGMYELTGNILDPRSSLCKMLWLKAEEPDNYRRTARFLQSKDYIVGRMTGGVDSTDYSDASHAQVLDVRQWRYAEELLADLDLDRTKLPELHRGVDVVGHLTDEAAREMGLVAGIPVVAGGGDGACATVGAGVVEPGTAYCCMGTTAWIACATDGPVIDPDIRVFNILSLDGETCGVYGTVQAAGSSLQWIMRMFGEEEFSRFEEAASSVAPGSENLIYLPYLEGERSPIWDADARGVFFGLQPIHGRGHAMRAVVEGVCYALRSVLDVFREDYVLDEMRVIGGGARSDLWCRALADVCGTVLHTLVAPAEHGTALGAAIGAGVGAGIFPSLADGARAIATESQIDPDPAAQRRYEPLYELYLSLYPDLKDAYARLAKLP